MQTIKGMATYCALALVCTFAHSNVQAYNDIDNKVIGHYDISEWKADGYSLIPYENNRYLLIGLSEYNVVKPLN